MPRRSRPLLACGRSPSDAHHLKFAQQRALGRKVSDEFTVPLCRFHHRELHQRGDELTGWQQLNVEPLGMALQIWQRTRPDGGGRADRWAPNLSCALSFDALDVFCIKILPRHFQVVVGL
jgi:hypothetical protein